MAKVKFKRVLTNSDVDNLDFDDGSFIVTAEGKTYIDYADSRIAIGGTPDTTMSDTSTNAVANKTVKDYVDTNIETVNNNIRGKSLYKNTSGTSNGNLNFNDTLNDYDYIEVYGYTSDGGVLYTKVPKYLYNKKVIFAGFVTDGTLYGKIGYLHIDTTNNRLSFNYNKEWYKPYNNSNGGYNSSGNYVYITEVIGYKTGLFN